MKAFRFTLDSVKVLRERQERDSLEVYALKLKRRQEAAEQVEKIHQELASTWMKMRSELMEGASCGEINRLRDFCRVLEERRKEAAAGLQLAEQEVNRTFQVFLKARAEREVVDKFFDSQKAAWDRTLSKEEQKLLDEMATRRSPAGELLKG